MFTIVVLVPEPILIVALVLLILLAAVLDVTSRI